MTITPAPQPAVGPPTRRKGELVNGIQEWIGYASLVACAYFVWPPAAFGIAGLVLVVTANLRDAAAQPARPAKTHWTERLAKALAVYRGGP